MKQPYPIHVVLSRNSFVEQMDWLKEQGCGPNQYTCFYGGPRSDVAGETTWAFREDASHFAIMLKLTFGGRH